jgi:glycosyltransferase involved in cell wall biosynthesis
VRIALVTETYPPELNGVAMTVSRAVDFLRERGFDVDLIRPAQRHESPGAVAHGLCLPGLPLPMYRDLRFGLPATGRLVRRWQGDRPALVHVATEGPLGWSAVRAARRLAIPATSDFRTDFPAYCRHYGLGWAAAPAVAYLRAFHNLTDRTFVPTSQMADRLQHQGFERLEVIDRGVDGGLFNPLRRDRRRREVWGAADSDPVLLHVGRLAPEKNVHLVFEAYRAIQARMPRARLVVIGEGPLKARLREAHPGVLFLGQRRGAELAECYASADIFLFPSLTDTFGNVVLEAMASGLLVIAFDCAAARTHIRSGLNGLLARPGDDCAFAAAARAAAWQLTTFSDLRRQARLSMEACTWDSVLRRFEASLLQVIQLAHVSYGQTATA